MSCVARRLASQVQGWCLGMDPLLSSGVSQYSSYIRTIYCYANLVHRYDEGIGLLYRTNTFHIASHELYTRLPHYILPSRLGQMSSFEIVLPLSVSKHQRGPLQPTSATLVPLLNMLAQSTGIRQLFLCLSCRQLRGSVTEVDVAHILKVMDEFVRKSDMESTVLQMNPVVLKGLTTKSCFLDEGAPTREDYSHQLWRCLDNETGQAEIHERVCSYPLVRSPLKDAALPELGQSRGYWIMKAVEEAPFFCTLS